MTAKCRHLALQLLTASPLLFAQQVTLDGTVVNAHTGAPMARTRVRLTAPRSATLYTVTDPQGHFRFTPPIPGKFTVEADRGGLNPARQFVDLTEGAATIQIPVTPGAVFTGTVTDPNGQPANYQDAHVEIYKRSLSPGMPRMRSVGSVALDDRGQFRSALLEPGSYYLGTAFNSSPPFDRTWHSAYYPHARDLDSALPIDLTPGQEFHADLQLVHIAGVGITGSVQVNSPAPPDANVEVELRGVLDPREPLIQTVSAKGGEYRVENVPPGEYSVRAIVRDILTAADRPAFGAYYRVTVGQQDAHLDLHLQALPELKGTVSFAGGCSTPVRISLNGVETLAAADGSFVLSGINPGHGPIYASSTTRDSGVWASSILLGGREVLQQELNYPWSDAGEIRVAMKCNAAGAQ